MQDTQTLTLQRCSTRSLVPHFDYSVFAGRDECLAGYASYIGSAPQARHCIFVSRKLRDGSKIRDVEEMNAICRRG